MVTVPRTDRASTKIEQSAALAAPDWMTAETPDRLPAVVLEGGAQPGASEELRADLLEMLDTSWIGAL